MARSHGRILARIWTDPEFLALDGEAQRAYMMLLSQPDLTHAGTLPLTIRRWSRLCGDGDVKALTASLRRLADARFVLVDGDTEELLIRTLIRNDGVFKQPKVLLSARSDAAAISSPKLRSALAAELSLCPLEEVTEKARADVAATLAQMVETLSPPPEPPPDTPTDTHSDTPGEGSTPGGDTPAETPGDGYSLARGGSPTPAPTPAPAPTVSDGAPSAALALVEDHQPTTAGDMVAEYVDACRKRPPEAHLKRIGQQVKALLAESIDADDIRAGLVIARERGLQPTALPGAVNEAMNAGGRIASRAGPPPNHTAQRTAANLEIVARYEAQERGA